MKKRLLFTCIAAMGLSQAHAQFEENFENGVPGKLTQKFLTRETTWIDFGLSSYYVQKPLSGGNSAVFFNGLETREVITALETPAMNLSLPGMVLEFKYLQRLRTPEGHNTLTVEMSNNNGESWIQLASYGTTSDKGINPVISLAKFNPGTSAIIRFVSTQPKVDEAYPIVLDDIKIYEEKKMTPSVVELKEVSVYPNPSTGIFNVNALDDDFSVTLFDLNGKSVFTKNYKTTTTVLDFTNMPKGIYLLKVNGKDYEKTQKITIN